MIGMVIAADEELKGLVPDASWGVQGVRDMVGGVVAVALVLAVGVIVIGCISMVPGLITNNVMERAFSWKRLAAALMVPFTIGAACTGWAWSANLFGSDGLKSNTSYSVAGRKVDSDALKDGREKGSDSLGSLVSQLGKDIASSIGDTVKDAVSSTVRESLEGWKWLTGGDGDGNVFQKGWDYIRKTWDEAFGNGSDASGDSSSASKKTASKKTNGSGGGSSGGR